MTREKYGSTIDELMIDLVTGFIELFGVGYKITPAEIRRIMNDKHGVNPGSVMPYDYCYNRVNKGINIRTKPTLFEYVNHDKGIIYKCLGKNYPYNGDVYHRECGHSFDTKVGVCENGERKISPKYQFKFKY